MTKNVNSEEVEETKEPSMSSYMFPTVIRKDDTGRAVGVDPVTYLFEKRIVTLDGPITAASAFMIRHELMVLDQMGTEPITLIINSGGGSVTAGMTIYEVMKSCRSQIHTVCTGMAASMAAILLASGDKRSAKPNARIMIHNLSAGAGGNIADIRTQVKEMEHTEEEMINLMAFHTGRTPEEYRKAIDRDNWMSAEQAKEFGLIDSVDFGVANARNTTERDHGYRGYYPGRPIPSVEAQKRRIDRASKSPKSATKGTNGWQDAAPEAPKSGSEGLS
ncbi:MAG: ClpP family protease [Candidatus Dormibacteria bacterium]